MIDRRRLRRLVSALRAGLRGFRAAPLVFALSVGTMTAGLLLLAAYLLVVSNMRAALAGFADDLQVVAYLAPEAASSPGLREELGRSLGSVGGVLAVRYVGPEAALERLRADLAGDADVLDGLERNPLPASFELEPEAEWRSTGPLAELVEQIAALPGVEEVRYGDAWLEGYSRIVSTAQWLGGVLGGLLALLLASIAAGTVRLALHARADEIQIQRLVGAGGTFIRLPFYLEGALEGGLAAALALALLFGLYGLGLPLLRELLGYLLGDGELAFFGPGAIAAILLLGAGLGMGGAALSLARLETSR